MNLYFGERWDAFVTDGAEQVPTPVGQLCGWCSLPIANGDRGLLIPIASLGEDGQPRYSAVPWHRECLTRSIVGSPAHLDGRCTCHGGPVCGDLTPQRMREEALEVWRRVQTGRLTGP